MYAIINTLNEFWLYGTNFKTTPYEQKCSNKDALIFNTISKAEREFKRRKCDSHFKIISVKLIPLDKKGNLIL